MRRIALVLAVLLVMPNLALAEKLQREIKSRWLGAWVLTEIESYSDCGTSFTNNRVNGNFVKGSGSRQFRPGELGKIVGIDAKRTRVDLHLNLAEPLLIAYQEGPFTLYREAECKIELEVQLPRDVMKNKDMGSIDQALQNLLESYATDLEAKESSAWNRRLREPFPADYASTLAALDVWRAEQTNTEVRTKLDDAYVHTTRLADRVSGDPDYVAGFVKGVEDAKQLALETCANLLGVAFQSPRGQRARSDEIQTAEQTRWERGFADGKNLVYGLAMIRTLPDCYVPVPADPGPADGG